MKLYQLGSPQPIETAPQDHEEIDLFKALIQPKDLVFDVGAHVGSKAELFLACGARVVCFEPYSCAQVNLIKRFADHPCVDIEPVGLGSKYSVEEFWINSDAPTISSFSLAHVSDSSFARMGYEWDTKMRVVVTTLDRMIAKYGMPAFCKIDVEHYEREVLQGLSQPMPCLSFECSAEAWDEAAECISYLEKLGVRAFNFAPGERGLFISPKWLEGRELMARLRSESDLMGDIYAKAD